MKDHRLLEALTVLIAAALLFAAGCFLMESAWVTAFIFFAVSIALFLMGMVAFICAFLIK